MRALILSAGLGERLRPTTLRLAKPAVPFLNVPSLAYPYYWLNQLGSNNHLSDLVFNTHHLADSVRHAAMSVVSPAISLHFPFEEGLLGSGGGIWNSRFYLDTGEDFFVANGDGVVLFEFQDELQTMLEFHRASKALCTLLVCPLEGVGSQIPGVWLDSLGEVSHFGKAQVKPHLSALHFTGYYVFSSEIFSLLPHGASNILYEVLAPAIQAGAKVMAYQPKSMRWFETGNAQDFLKSTQDVFHEVYERTVYGQRAREIVEQFAPYSSWFMDDRKHMALIDSSVNLPPHFEHRGFMVAGPNSVIEDFTKLENSVLLPGSRLKQGQTLSHTLL